MRLDLLDDSRVFIDLRASGLLAGVAHDPTLVAVPELVAIDADLEHGDVDAPVSVRFAAADIEPPLELRDADRDKMRANLLGPEVLDASHHPRIELRGRYVGTLAEGTLSGDLEIRGRSRAIAMPVDVEREANRLIVRGSWEGPLSALGVKPFRALLGALKLADWVRLRLDARLLIRGE
jgi:polyisoprenoid-binding protein YceI